MQQTPGRSLPRLPFLHLHSGLTMLVLLFPRPDWTDGPTALEASLPLPMEPASVSGGEHATRRESFESISRVLVSASALSTRTFREALLAAAGVLERQGRGELRVRLLLERLSCPPQFILPSMLGPEQQAGIHKTPMPASDASSPQPLLWVWWEVRLPRWQQQQLCRLLQIVRTPGFPKGIDVWMLNGASVEAFWQVGSRLELEGLGEAPIRVLRERPTSEPMHAGGRPRARPKPAGERLEAVAFRLLGQKPPVEDTLALGERLRRALLKLRAPGGFSPALVGKTEAGTPLLGNAHAYFVPLDTDQDGHLDEVLVLAPAGFSTQDHDAFLQLRFLSGDEQRGLGLSLCLEGSIDALRDQGACDVFETSRVWISATPFALPFFASGGKGRAPRPRDLPAGQLKRELRSRDLPEPVEITELEGWTDALGRLHRWRDFQHERRNLTHGNGLAGFRVTFEVPVAGPILLGFGAHFGLGLFVPERQGLDRSTPLSGVDDRV